MHRLHWMILRQLPGPFFGWLCTLMFLMLMQFLIMHLPDLAGKGLGLFVILELISYSLAYMVVLAVPMAVLLATLLVFGRLSETNTYAVLKSAGISVGQLIWPVLIVGLLTAAGLAHFNNVILPESNFRAKNLWQDIRTKQPGFELQPGVFYDGLSNYSILVEDVEEGENVLRDVTIYDYTEGSRQQTIIKAKRGELQSLAGGAVIQLQLQEGEIHRLRAQRAPQRPDRYEQLDFGLYQMRIDVSDFTFERSGLREGYRSDRTTRTDDMLLFVDSLQTERKAEQMELHKSVIKMITRSADADTLEQDRRDTRDDGRVTATPIRTQAAPDLPDTVSTSRLSMRDVPDSAYRRVYNIAIDKARSVRSTIEETERSVNFKNQRINRYKIEIYKKYSIAVACFIFVLIGAPLGLSIGRGGLGVSGGLALAIFIFYWVSLVQGEKLADRGIIEPWVGMWTANIIMSLAALWLIVYVTLDLRATPPLRTRLWTWLRRKLPAK